MSLKCHSAGQPLPMVTWSRLGGPLPDGNASHKDSRLYYDNASLSHSGIYRCTAQNGVGKPAIAEITVEVYSKDVPKHAPTVQTERKFVPVIERDTIFLSCNYTAYPPPQVHWIFNSFQINSQSAKKERMTITFAQPSAGHDLQTTTLKIVNVEQSDFGEYICRVANSLGTTEEHIDVSGKPGPPYLFSAAVYGDRIDLSWHLDSAADMLGYKLFYRKKSEDFSLSIDIPSHYGRRVKDNEWSANYTWRFLAKHKDLLQSDSDYQLAVQGVNQYGEGSLPKPLLDVRTPVKFDFLDDGNKGKHDDDKLKEIRGQSVTSKSTKVNGGHSIRSNRLVTWSLFVSLITTFLTNWVIRR
jgi:hypothetical protein